MSEVKELPHKNLAIETLRKLLTDEIKGRAPKNLVPSRQFSEMLEDHDPQVAKPRVLRWASMDMSSENDQRNAVQNRSAKL